MSPSSTPLLLAVALLLTGLTGCAKQEEIVPAEVQNVARYTYDGQVVACQATQHSIPSPVPGYDYLVVTMTTTPQPSSGPEYLELTMRRPTGYPVTAYLVPNEGVVLHNQANPTGLAFQYNVPTYAFARNGSLTGTFYSEVRTPVPNGTYTVPHTLSSGTFTSVQP